MWQGRSIVGLVATALCACHAAPKPAAPKGHSPSTSSTAQSKSVAPCRNVRVVDEAGRPLVGATAYSVATAWAGPDGAFFVEGGSERRFESPHVTTGRDGGACVEDAAAQAEKVRGKVNAVQPSKSFVPYGGIGLMRVGEVKPRGIFALYQDWPMGFQASPGEQGLVVLGPPRTREVRVESECDPSSLSLAATTGAHIVSARQPSASRPVFRLEGLGPFTYQVAVQTCDGATSMHDLDARLAGETRVIDVRRPQAGTRPAGRPAQLALHEGGGCLVTDQGELGCFSKLDYRSDLQPPQLLPRWQKVPRLEAVAKVTSSGYFHCALTRTGSVHCWGYDNHGALGSGDVSSTEDALPVVLPARALDLQAGMAHVCARLEGDGVACWGWNAYGQLGIGSRSEVVGTPASIPAWRGAKDIALGSMHTCALLKDGGVSCAGWKDRGVVGTGPFAIDSYAPSPTRVPGVSGALVLSATYAASYALSSAGDVMVWGSMPSEHAAAPPHRLPFRNVAQVAASNYHVCLRSKEGSVTCFGSTEHGAIPGGVVGVGRTTVPHDRAVAIPGLTPSQALSVSNSLSCSLSSDGSVHCWGTGATTSAYWHEVPFARSPTLVQW